MVVEKTEQTHFKLAKGIITKITIGDRVEIEVNTGENKRTFLFTKSDLGLPNADDSKILTLTGTRVKIESFEPLRWI